MGSSGGAAPGVGPRPADYGFLAWNFPSYAGQALTALPTSGRLELLRIPDVPPGPVTNIIIQLSSAGVGLTDGYAVLYAPGGGLLGITEDQSAEWGSSGQKVMPLDEPYINPALGALYAGLWFVGGTGPTLVRANNVAASYANGLKVAPNLLFANANTGLTTVPPDPFGAQVASATTWWVGLS